LIESDDILQIAACATAAVEVRDWMSTWDFIGREHPPEKFRQILSDLILLMAGLCHPSSTIFFAHSLTILFADSLTTTQS
jgi:hypothetical protein